MTTTENTAGTTAPPAERRDARVAGWSYLAVAVTGMVGFLLVRAQLHVPGDAAATAANLVGQEPLARLGLAAVLRGALLRFFFHGVAPRPAGLAGPVMVMRMPLQRATCLLIQAACLATNSSRLISPLCTMSSACSQIAVVPGSAIARGTASIRLNAAGVADSALPFFTR